MKRDINMRKQINSEDFISSYLNEIIKTLNNLNYDQINSVINLILKAYYNNKNVYILGNGGNASTASHMACDLGKGTLAKVYDNSEKRLRVISLTDNVALISAYANDLSYKDIFLQQLRNLVNKEDLVIVLSGSGNSENLIKAVKYSKKEKAITIGILGFNDGGKLGKIVDHPILIQSNHYGPIEDTQLILNHLISSFIAKVKNEKNGKIKNYKSKNKSVPYT